MAQVFIMLAVSSMQVYRARNPKKSPLWQCADRHYDEFEAVYPEAYQPRYGSLRPIIGTATKCAAFATEGCPPISSRTARAFRRHLPSNSRPKGGAT